MWAAIRHWVVLSLLAAAGVGLIFWSHSVQDLLSKEFIKEIGFALLISAILGLTVDRALKFRLARDLSKDAFHASFQYILPPEVRDELSRIIDYRFICRDHLMYVEIEEIGNDLVSVGIRLQRDLTNVSSQTEKIHNSFALDEWNFPGHKSEIGLCMIEIDGKTIDGTENPDYDQRPDAIAMKTVDVAVKKGQTVRFISSGNEIGRSSGQLLMNLKNPTVRPRVVVRLPRNFKHECTFGVPGGKEISSYITEEYTLDGTQFPGQYIRIRWRRETE